MGVTLPAPFSYIWFVCCVMFVFRWVLCTQGFGSRLHFHVGNFWCAALSLFVARWWVRLIVGHDNDIAAVITLSHALNSSSGSAP